MFRLFILSKIVNSISVRGHIVCIHRLLNISPSRCFICCKISIVEFKLVVFFSIDDIILLCKFGLIMDNKMIIVYGVITLNRYIFLNNRKIRKIPD